MNTFTNENGIWEIIDGVKLLIEPSQKWLEENLTQEELPQPLSIEEQLAIKDLQIKTLEIQQKQLNEDLLAFMDYVTMGGM